MLPQSAEPAAPVPTAGPLLTHASAGDTQTLKGRSGPDLYPCFKNVTSVLFALT